MPQISFFVLCLYRVINDISKLKNNKNISCGVNADVCYNIKQRLPTQNAWIPIVVMISVTVICTGIAVKFFKWE